MEIENKKYLKLGDETARLRIKKQTNMIKIVSINIASYLSSTNSFVTLLILQP